MSVIQKNNKIRKRHLCAGSSIYFYYFQFHLFRLDPSTLFGYVHYKYEFFKLFNINNINSSLLKLENRRNSLHTNGAEPFGIFLILEKFICLLFYFITFTMNACDQGFSLLGDWGGGHSIH